VDDPLSSTEALHAFMAWLTTRDEVSTFSAHHDSAPAVALIRTFVMTNDLPDVRDDYADRFTMPQ